MSFADLVRLARAHRVEYQAFLAYQNERSGETHGHGKVEYHNVRPSEVARCLARWEAAITEVRALATPDEVRGYLQRKTNRNGARRAMRLPLVRREQAA